MRPLNSSVLSVWSICFCSTWILDGSSLYVHQATELLVQSLLLSNGCTHFASKTFFVSIRFTEKFYKLQRRLVSHLYDILQVFVHVCMWFSSLMAPLLYGSILWWTGEKLCHLYSINLVNVEKVDVFNEDASNIFSNPNPNPHRS